MYIRKQLHAFRLVPSCCRSAAAPGFRKDVTPLIRTPRGLEDMSNASLQRGRQAEGFCEAVG